MCARARRRRSSSTVGALGRSTAHAPLLTLASLLLLVKLVRAFLEATAHKADRRAVVRLLLPFPALGWCSALVITAVIENAIQGLFLALGFPFCMARVPSATDDGACSPTAPPGLAARVQAEKGASKVFSDGRSAEMRRWRVPRAQRLTLDAGCIKFAVVAELPLSSTRVRRRETMSVARPPPLSLWLHASTPPRVASPRTTCRRAQGQARTSSKSLSSPKRIEGAS